MLTQLADKCPLVGVGVLELVEDDHGIGVAVDARQPGTALEELRDQPGEKVEVQPTLLLTSAKWAAASGGGRRVMARAVFNR